MNGTRRKFPVSNVYARCCRTPVFSLYLSSVFSFSSKLHCSSQRDTDTRTDLSVYYCCTQRGVYIRERIPRRRDCDQDDIVAILNKIDGYIQAHYAGIKLKMMGEYR